MAIKDRVLRMKEETRNKILDVSLGIVKADGWQALSIRKIADAIEYSVPVVYDYFENKEAILFEISMDGFRLLQKKLEAALKKHDDPEDQLKALADAYWNFAFKNKEYYQLMYGLGMPCCGAGRMKPEVNAFNDLVYEAISNVISKKKSNPEEACFKTHAFWSVIHGLISIMIMRTSDINSTMNKKVMDDTVAAFIKNL
ncbi:MAG: TetR/AcrR family transcriptional regulator [Bacteroidetes bacterium]|nr:MAG: TetR/AcrR family transcriptional regulator [Bacteroidota bacterium]